MKLLRLVLLLIAFLMACSTNSKRQLKVDQRQLVINEIQREKLDDSVSFSNGVIANYQSSNDYGRNSQRNSGLTLRSESHSWSSSSDTHIPSAFTENLSDQELIRLCALSVGGRFVDSDADFVHCEQFARRIQRRFSATTATTGQAAELAVQEQDSHNAEDPARTRLENSLFRSINFARQPENSEMTKQLLEPNTDFRPQVLPEGAHEKRIVFWMIVFEDNNGIQSLERNEFLLNQRVLRKSSEELHSAMVQSARFDDPFVDSVFEGKADSSENPIE